MGCGDDKGDSKLVGGFGAILFQYLVGSGVRSSSICGTQSLFSRH